MNLTGSRLGSFYCVLNSEIVDKISQDQIIHLSIFSLL